jgi:hypothetical protein
MDDDTARFLNELEQALTGEDRGGAQDRLAEFIRNRAQDISIVAPVMAMIENLDKIRRYYAIDALVFVSLNAPDNSEIEKAALAKWDELMERIAAKDIFEALKWASHPGLFCEPEALLAAQGISKWSELIDRAAIIDPARALQHARDMAQAEPWNPFAIIAGMSADAIEGQMKQKAGMPPPPAPPQMN